MKKKKDDKFVNLTENLKQELIRAGKAICGKSFLLTSGRVVTKYDTEWQQMTFCDKVQRTVAAYDSNTNEIKLL